MITYVFDGAIAQQDSHGREVVLGAGSFQRTTPGHGIRHSERNPSPTDWARVFQMWLHPTDMGPDSLLEQKLFGQTERRGALCLVASPDARHGSLLVQRDALIYSVILGREQRVDHALTDGRVAWIHIVRGQVVLGDIVLGAGDGAGVTGQAVVSLTAASEDSEVLLLDLGAKPLSTARKKVPLNTPPFPIRMQHGRGSGPWSRTSTMSSPSSRPPPPSRPRPRGWLRLGHPGPGARAGPEPEVRTCPTCRHIGMSNATLCGYCWTRLTPLEPTDSLDG